MLRADRVIVHVVVFGSHSDAGSVRAVTWSLDAAKSRAQELLPRKSLEWKTASRRLLVADAGALTVSIESWVVT